MLRNQARGLWRSPSPYRLGAYTPVRLRSSSANGYPSAMAMRIEKERPSRGRDNPVSTSVKNSSQFLLVFYPTSHGMKGMIAFADFAQCDPW